MKILRLELDNYNWLFLNNIRRLVYIPQRQTQVILGTNGSGKSSLLRMLTPLPPDLKNDFGIDGRKYLEIEHHGIFFVLESTLKNKPRHSFIVNEVELNLSGNITTQIELVRDYFNITPQTQSVLLGQTKLTGLSVADRKTLFTDLSENDYTYALEIYNKTRTRLRDISGSIRISQENLQRIKTAQKTTEEINDTRVAVEHILRLLGTLKTFTLHINKNLIDINPVIESFLKDTAKLKQIVDSLGNGKIDVKTLEDDIVFARAEVKIMTVNTLKKTDEFMALKSKKENNLTLTAYEKRLTEINVELDNVVLEYELPVNFDTVSEVKEWVECILDPLNNIFYNLKNNSETVAKYGGLRNIVDGTASATVNAIITTKQTEHSTIVNRKNSIRSDIGTYEDILKSTNTVRCPMCNTEWLPDYDEEKHEQLKSAYVKAEENFITSDKELTEYINTYSRLSKLRDLLLEYGSFFRLGSKNDSLNGVIRWILSDGNTLDTDILIVEERVYSLLHYSLYLSGYVELHNERKDITEKLVANSNENERNSLALSDKLDVLECDIVKDNETIAYKNNYITMLLDRKKQVELARKFFEGQKKSLDTFKKIKKNVVNVSLSKQYAEEINDLNGILFDLNVVLKENQDIRDKISSLEKEISNMKQDEQNLKKLSILLSPTEGIIGRGLSGFMNSFISEMNKVISSIWTYDFKINSCGISDNGELTYLFPLTIDGRQSIEDVSKLSQSMRDVVDLAFKIVYIKYRKLDVPLVLDEFGSSMDTEHQIRSFNIIGDKLTNNFEQLFVVSHFESMYGRFTNSDVSVLDPSNLNNDTVRSSHVLSIS